MFTERKVIKSVLSQIVDKYSADHILDFVEISQNRDKYNKVMRQLRKQKIIKIRKEVYDGIFPFNINYYTVKSTPICVCYEVINSKFPSLKEYPLPNVHVLVKLLSEKKYGVKIIFDRKWGVYIQRDDNYYVPNYDRIQELGTGDKRYWIKMNKWEVEEYLM